MRDSPFFLSHSKRRTHAKGNFAEKSTKVNIIAAKHQKYTILLGVYADYFYICRQLR